MQIRQHPEGGDVGGRAGQQEGQGRSRRNPLANQDRHQGRGSRSAHIDGYAQQGEEPYLQGRWYALHPLTVERWFHYRGDRQPQQDPRSRGIDHFAQAGAQTGSEAGGPAIAGSIPGNGLRQRCQTRRCHQASHTPADRLGGDCRGDNPRRGEWPTQERQRNQHRIQAELRGSHQERHGRRGRHPLQDQTPVDRHHAAGTDRQGQPETQTAQGL